MDPNTALDRLRELARQLLDGNHIDDIAALALAVGACEQFEALDQWLSNGGFKPKEWE